MEERRVGPGQGTEICVLDNNTVFPSGAYEVFIHVPSSVLNISIDFLI